uniref:Mitochondrial carrier protein n=1 Tax=Solanum tuberosum TaxID=4113 RepID=M1AGD8_SOLTU
MVLKELITHRIQSGAKGRSWQVLMRILDKDGILRLYAGYSATLLRNFSAGALSYSLFDYLKAKDKKGACGAISECLLWGTGWCNISFISNAFRCGEDLVDDSI